MPRLRIKWAYDDRRSCPCALIAAAAASLRVGRSDVSTAGCGSGGPDVCLEFLRYSRPGCRWRRTPSTTSWSRCPARSWGSASPAGCHPSRAGCPRRARTVEGCVVDLLNRERQFRRPVGDLELLAVSDGHRLVPAGRAGEGALDVLALDFRGAVGPPATVALDAGQRG